MSVTDVLMTRAATNGYSHPRPRDPGMVTREAGAGAGGVGMGRIQEMLVGYSQADQAESRVLEISETGNRAWSHPSTGNSVTGGASSGRKISSGYCRVLR